MAKQWKIGTAYVEVEARLKLATQMQAQSQQINAAAKRIGESASKSMTAAMSIAGKEQLKIINESKRVAEMFKNIGQWSANKVFPAEVVGTFGGGRGGGRIPPRGETPGSSGFEDAFKKNTPLLDKFGDSLLKAGRSAGKGLTDLASSTKAYLVTLAGVTGTLYALGEAASPDTMKTLWDSTKLLSAQIGSFVVPEFQEFAFKIQQAAAAVEQYRKGEIKWYEMLTGGKPIRALMDVQGKPQISSIADAWKQLQMAAGYGMLHPLEMQTRRTQLENLQDFFTRTQRANAQQPKASIVPATLGLPGAVGGPKWDTLVGIMKLVREGIDNLRTGGPPIPAAPKP